MKNPFRTQIVTMLVTLAVVAFGFGMRINALSEVIDEPELTGDAYEYFMAAVNLASFLKTGELVHPGLDRTLGLPVLLSGLYLATDHPSLESQKQEVPIDWVVWQRTITTLLSCAVLIALTVVSYIEFGPPGSLVSAVLVAPNSFLVRHAIGGLTEELFGFLILLALLLLWRHRRIASVWCTLAFGSALGWLVLTKYEGFLLLPPLVVAYVLARPGTLIERVRHALAVLMPSAVLLFISKSYVSALGAVSSSDRGGNYLFFREFLSDRMPWGYMRDLRFEGFRISYLDWLLDYHSLADVMRLAVQGTAAILGFSLEFIGLLGAALFIVGAVHLVRNRRWTLPSVLLASLAPYVLLLGFYPEDRYLFPLIPLYALIAAASFGPLSDRWSYLRERRHLFLIPVSALLFATTAWKQEQSQGSWWIAKPFVKSQEALAHCRNAVQLARKRDFQGARRDFDSCAEQLPSFAPAHFGLATVRYSMGEKTMAEQSLRQALDMVPYFAEAHVMLGDLLSEHAPNEARSQFNSCIDARSDFSPCYLSMAILDFQEHRYEAALTGFETYMALNRQALRNAQEVCNSKKESRWMAPCSDNVLGQLHDVTDSDNPLVSGMMSGIVRDYLYMRTRSYGTDAWAPVDRRLGLQIGVTHEALGNLEEARRYYRRHLDLHPDSRAGQRLSRSLRDPVD